MKLNRICALILHTINHCVSMCWCECWNKKFSLVAAVKVCIVNTYTQPQSSTIADRCRRDFKEKKNWEKFKKEMHSAMNAINLANSQIISDDTNQILNMNKRMKVRRKMAQKSFKTPQFSSRAKANRSSSWLLSSSSSFYSFKYSSSSLKTSTKNTMFAIILTLFSVIGIALCAGK